jgi:hypothetical protein
LIAIALLGTGAAAAATINVPADAATIQAGIDLARAGDIVLVAPGTYRGSVTIHVTKAITLASQYHTTGVESYIDQTIIDSSAATTLDVTAAGAGAVITGFTIRGDKGIQVMAGAEVIHCAFLDTGGDSLSWEDGGAGRFADNRFVNCGDDCIDSDDDSNGVAGGDRIIERNTMNGAGDDCIEIRLQSYTGTEMKYHVRNNRFENCTDDGLQLIDYSGLSSRRFFIYRNLFYTRGTSGVGATADGSTDQTGSGSPIVEPVQIFNNTIIGPKWGIVGGANMLIVNNIIKGTSLYALRMLQGQSWAAYNDLYQNAAEADASSQPLVGEGTLRTDPLLDTSYRLTAGSPCINAGVAHYEKNGQVLDVTDAIGAAPDIGFDEYGGGGGTPTNQPPSVNAGPDRQTFHPTSTILIDGTVTDDGRPGTGIDITWSKMEGPGTVTFSNPKAADTDATFGKQGTYKLKIEASDGELSSSDSAVIKYVQDGSGAKIDIAAPGTTYFEAESFSWLYAPAGGVNDAAASGGRAILAPEGQGTEGRTEYTLALRQGGYSYYVWVRMAGPDSAGDAVAVSFNGGAERVLTTTADGDYHWQKMDGSFISPAGEYPFIIRAAEDGVRWDRIAFSTDAAFVPDDTATTRLEVRVAAGSDDAEESSSGSVSLGSSDLELVTDASVQTVGIRFAGLAIPPGAVIRSAAVQFQVDEATSDATALTIHAQAADNAPTFTTATANISSRPRTAAQAPWVPAAWNTIGAAGVEQRSADLSAVIQEIVDRAGWVSGNAIAIVITGSGKRVAAAYEVSAAAAPILIVEYVQRGADTEPPAAPTGFVAAATQEAGAIQLDWNANGEADLAGYRLLYGTASGLYTTTLNVGKVTTYTVRGLDSGSTWYFALKAFDTSGNLGDPSAEASAKPKVAVGALPAITSAIEVATGSVYILQSGRHGVRVDGSNFQNGAVVGLGSDIAAGPASLTGSTRLTLTIDVGAAAALGPRAVTVTNPDTGQGTRQEALRVVKTPDIDRSCRIDGVDLNILARSWSTRNIDAAYCAACDLDGVNGVDGDDLAIFIEYFGQRLAVCP